MNRREFIRHLALIAAGSTAISQQIDALERFYEANAPAGASTLIALDDICIGGVAPVSTPLIFDLLRGDRMVLRFPWNAFGGMVRWSPMPDQRLIAAPGELRWEIRPPEAYGTHVSPSCVEGFIGFIDSDGLRQTIPLTVKGTVE